MITTAQVFGRKPPVLVTRDMIAGMRPGSVIVDMAAETGGNVEGSVPDETVVVNGVTIIGDGNLGELRRARCQPDVFRQPVQPDRGLLAQGREAPAC